MQASRVTMVRYFDDGMRQYYKPWNRRGVGGEGGRIERMVGKGG
jgi:hypothetical protein